MIIGTAGHIDHGKSALVRALTGVDTDRLKEEKARGISIDLGFAYMPVDGAPPLGFVDAPGHERFVRNMLAGATGIDFVLIVVAADDGVMPQTREHLAILDLLGIPAALVVLTKVDLVPPERRRAARAEIRALLQGTGFASADILEASAATGEGIEALRTRLVEAARAFRPRRAEGRFRMAVDRCFSLTGAGTVVTGSVIAGAVAVGDTVVVSPGGLAARVRSIHAQNRAAERGEAGERCALNLAGEGVSRHAIARGDMVLDPVLHAPADRIDATLRLLASEPRPLAHWTPARLHHGAADVAARIALLEEAPIAPGEEGRIQLVLERPIAAAVGDRFVLRDTSRSRTMGGGRLVDLRGPGRRRRTPERLGQLDALGREGAGAALAPALDRWPWFVDLTAFARDRALGGDQVQAMLQAVPHVRVAARGQDLVLSPGIWRRTLDSARTTLEAFHMAHPQLLGLGLARLGGALEPRLPAKVAAAVVQTLASQGDIALEGGLARLPGHRLALDKGDQALWERIRPLLSAEARFRPPRVGEIAERLSAREFDVRRVLKAQARRQEVMEAAVDHFFLRDTLDEMAAIAADIAAGQEDGLFTAAQFRDRLNNGRKVAIQILEYFDRHGLTLRRGDLRRIDPRRVRQFARTAAPAMAGTG